MIIIIILIALFILLTILTKVIDNSDAIPFLVVGWVILGISIFIAFITIVRKDMDVNADIARYEAIRTTVENARRTNNTEYERATLTTRIVEINCEIAKKKAYATHPMTNWFFSPKYLTVKLIE